MQRGNVGPVVGCVIDPFNLGDSFVPLSKYSSLYTAYNIKALLKLVLILSLQLICPNKVKRRRIHNLSTNLHHSTQEIPLDTMQAFMFPQLTDSFRLAPTCCVLPLLFLPPTLECASLNHFLQASVKCLPLRLDCFLWVMGSFFPLFLK